MAERIGGKLESVIAAAILVVVAVLFVKYYDHGQSPDSASRSGPSTSQGVH
jgi:hypothetical protein